MFLTNYYTRSSCSPPSQTGFAHGAAMQFPFSSHCLWCRVSSVVVPGFRSAGPVTYIASLNTVRKRRADTTTIEAASTHASEHLFLDGDGGKGKKERGR